MQSLHLNLMALEIFSLGLLRTCIKASAVGLGMAFAMVLLALFWSGSALGEVLEAISEQRSR